MFLIKLKYCTTNTVFELNTIRKYKNKNEKTKTEHNRNEKNKKIFKIKTEYGTIEIETEYGTIEIEIKNFDRKLF